MTLSPRAREVLLCLLSQEPHVMTTAEIANELQVSSRTIQRILPEAGKWLSNYGAGLEAKTGSGVHLLADESQCTRILDALHSSNRAEWTRSERQTEILTELLSARQPIKAAWFCQRYGISSGTLSGDLDELSAWAEQFGLTLSRKAGRGIELEGEEAALRLAIASIIDTKSLLRLLQGDDQAHSRLLFPSGISEQNVAQLEQIVAAAEEKWNIALTDSGYAGLFVRLSLSLKRMMDGETIVMPSDQLARLRLMPEYAVAEFIADALQDAFSIVIPADEIGFITMHLAGSSARSNTDYDRMESTSLDVYHLARRMTNIVESQLGVCFDDIESLLNGLSMHLEPTIRRLCLGGTIVNGDCGDIRSNYPELYRATECACSVLCEELHLEHIPEAEIEYITAHFGAAVEALCEKQRVVSAVVVCPTGLGTSRLLQTLLSKTFPRLRLCGTLSAFRLDVEQLKRDSIDLIISTVDLDIDYRYIRVTPLMTEREKQLLTNVVDSLSVQKNTQRTQTHKTEKPLNRDDIIQISLLGSELFELIDHAQISAEHIAHSRAELIEYASHLFAEDDITADIICQQLRARDELADTYIKPFYALLLHCRTECVTHCRMGYVRLQPPFYEEGKMILGAIVMLIPQNDSETACQSVMSEVSALLVDHPELLQFARSNDLHNLKIALTEYLLEYYRRTVRELLN